MSGMADVGGSSDQSCAALVHSMRPYRLTEGLPLIHPSSVGYTDVPERLGHYIRQQIRWPSAPGARGRR